MKLTKAQIEVLSALAEDHVMVFSEDGDNAWLYPNHHTGILSDEQTIVLRNMGYIDKEKGDEDDYGRFGAPDVITPAGRAALAEGGA